MRGRRVGWIAVLIVAVLTAAASGRGATLADAADVARGFLSEESAGSELYRRAMSIPAQVEIRDARALTDAGSAAALAYVFELKPTGYIVATTDTRLAPIVAYSFASPFAWDESVQNILLDMLRQDMANRLRAVTDGRMDAVIVEENERRWEDLRKARAPDRAPLEGAYAPNVYGPWTLAPWHQGAPYWDDCPMDPNEPPAGTHRCVVGCVATALAQILNYWQYPTSITFQASDDYTSSFDPEDGHGTRTIPINATAASFSGLFYNQCNPSDAAKADLSYAAGVSVRMGYSSVGSSATTAKVAPALAGSWYPWASPPPQRWGYHSADLRTYNATYSGWGSPYYVTQAAFFSELQGNMIQARPAEMAITSSGSTSGHAIVVDGYHPANDDYHLNYGWGNTNYGWYSLPAGMPSGYDVIRYAVLNIVPTTATYTLATSTSGTGSGTVQALPGTGALTRGTHALVSATPSPGSSFGHWTGALSGSDNPALVILDGNKSINAVFEASGGAISSKKWTVMVYLAADNNLGGGTPGDPDFMDFDEMETALLTSGAALDVVVLWDKPGTNDSYIYWVQPDAAEGALATYADGVNRWTPPGGSEADMGAQSTLTGFLDWVFERFLSDHYGLILWNHGGGWAPKSETASETTRIPSTYVATDGELTDILLEGNDALRSLQVFGDKMPKEEASPVPPEPLETGICWDDTDGGDYLTTREAAYGIEDSTRGWTDNLGLDACLMQMLEVAYEFYRTPQVAADYLTASQASEWGWGWAYHQILSVITTSTTPRQLAELWGATRTSRHYAGGLDTISSVSLWEMGSLASEVGALANRLSALLATRSEYEGILYAKLFAEWFPYTDSSYIDLGDFCAWLDQFLNDATAKTLAQAVTQRLATAVVAMSNGMSFSPYGSATGLSIYLPHAHDLRWADWYGAPLLADYSAANLAFCADHAWDEFVNAWLAADYVDPYEPNDTPETAHDRGTAFGESVTYLFWEADFDDDTEDWYRMTIPFWFDLDAWVWCTEYSADTVLYAYDSLANAQASAHFAANDDGMQGLGYPSFGSRIQASALQPGTYYFQVVPWGSYGTQEDYELWITITRGADGPAVFRVDSSGYVYLDGTLYSPSLATGAADVAEWVIVSEQVDPGDLLELDPENPGMYRKARGPCSPWAAGAVSTQPGVLLGGEVLGPAFDGIGAGRAPLALAGIVPVKVTDEGGPIWPGDLLVSSSAPGYARRWDPGAGPCGILVGKAMEALDEPEGRILVLLMR